MLLPSGGILDPGIFLSLSFLFHILEMLPGISAIISMKCPVHSKNSINSSHFCYDYVRSDHKLENGKTANFVNSIVFSGIFSILFLVTCIAHMLVIYVFIKYRHWHSEHKRFHSFTK